MTLMEEWKGLFARYNRIYIYGAGDVALLLLRLAEKYGNLQKVIALLVSEPSGHHTALCGIPVLRADSISDKSVAVLIGVSKKYYDEVVANAEKMGFTDLKDGFKFIHLFDENSNSTSKSVDFNSLRKMSREEFKSELFKILGKEQLFGDDGFYQSLPALGIRGARPSDFRIKTYRLDKIVKGKDVLDIGSNCGFLDLSVAEYAKSITGVEYAQNLVDVGNAAAAWLGVDTVHFEQGDFTKWECKEKKDVVLYFAVHGWINMSARQGVEKIKSILHKQGGGMSIRKSGFGQRRRRPAV